MLESGVIHNIWSKYRVKKAEVNNINISWIFQTDPLYCHIFSSLRVNLLEHFIHLLQQGCLGNGLDALAMDNLQGIFLLLLGAFALAILLLIIECFIKYGIHIFLLPCFHIVLQVQPEEG